MGLRDNINKFWRAAMAGYKAFQEKYTTSDQINLANFTDWDARRLRYSILWAMYENTAYDKIHSWSQSYKTQKGLYEYVRNIYNPSYRLGNFWQAKLLGGALDPAAGDGGEVPSCLPIVMEREDRKLRRAIAQVWAWSNWQIKKDVFGLWTPVLGDGVLKIVDDPEREKVYIKIIHPSRLADVTLDDWGNVKGYELCYMRPDPRPGRSGEVKYREIAYREEGDENVYYETYLDQALYAWNESKGAQWSEPYGFVPMVVLQHNDVGLDFGWSELYPGLSKFREVDDQASKLNDQIRKLVEGAWLLSGVAKPLNTPVVNGQAGSQTEMQEREKPQIGRSEMKIIYSNNPQATATSLVSPIQVADVASAIKDLIEELERDYPELRVDLANATGDISGKALRTNRAPAAAKVLQRRPNYDNALVRAHQMAVAIGGFGNYGEAFRGFSLESFQAGKLAHSIGERPVFDVDPMDELEQDGVFWDNATKAKAAGVPLPVYLKQQGWDEESIAEITGSEEYQLRTEGMRNAISAFQTSRGEGSNPPPGNNNQNQDDEDDDE